MCSIPRPLGDKQHQSHVDTYVQNTSYRDEWIFIYDYCNMYIGAQNGDPLMLPILSAVHNQFSSNGYFGFGYTDLTKPQLH